MDEPDEHAPSRHPGLDRRRFLSGGAAAAAAVAVAPRLLTGAGPAGGTAVRALGPLPARARAAIAPPPVVSRLGWGADERLRQGTPGFAPLSRLVVHHTVTTNADPDPAATIRGIHRQHVIGNGWSDIGYNFVIDADGRVYEGRYGREAADGEVHDGEDGGGRGVIGAHTEGYNTGAVGVALLGTFEYGALPTARAVDSLVGVLAWKASRHGIDPTATLTAGKLDGTGRRTVGAVAGHRDYKSTACPGKDFYAMLGAVRERVRRRLLTGLVGYRILGSDGALLGFGDTEPIGDLLSTGLRGAGVRAAVGTPIGGGAWVVGPDGGIFTFGDARFFGSMGAVRLNEAMVGMAGAPDGAGYWTVASDGGIFTFGSAGFFGSTGAIDLNQPIVGMAATPTGLGYWLVASDGGIFAFGDAGFHGSLPQARVPAVGGARSVRSSPSGRGYWVLDGAGTVTSFGDATPFGGGVGAGRSALDLVPVVR